MKKTEKNVEKKVGEDTLSFGEAAVLGFSIKKEKVVGKTIKDGKSVELKETIFTFRISDLPDFKKPVGISQAELTRVFFSWALRQRKGHGVHKILQNFLSSQFAVLVRGALTRLYNAGKTSATLDEVLAEYCNDSAIVAAMLTEVQLRERATNIVLEQLISGKIQITSVEDKDRLVEEELQKLKTPTPVHEKEKDAE